MYTIDAHSQVPTPFGTPTTRTLVRGKNTTGGLELVATDFLSWPIADYRDVCMFIIRIIGSGSLCFAIRRAPHFLPGTCKPGAVHGGRRHTTCHTHCITAQMAWRSTQAHTVFLGMVPTSDSRQCVIVSATLTSLPREHQRLWGQPTRVRTPMRCIRTRVCVCVAYARNSHCALIQTYSTLVCACAWHALAGWAGSCGKRQGNMPPSTA